MSKFKNFIKYIYYNTHRLLLQSFTSLCSHPLNVNDIKSALIISPHPDDEVFGCAHLMQRLVQQKKDVHIVILSRGEAVHRKCCPNIETDIVTHRKQLTINANKIIGIPKDRIYFLDFPDGNFDRVVCDKNYSQKLSELIFNISPNAIFYPHPFEYSPDHQAATKMLNNILTGSNIKQFYYCVWVWYHMPIYKIFQLNFHHSFYIKTQNKYIKERAIDIYTNNKAQCGVSYSGDLPKPFLNAFHWNKELLFLAN